MPSRPDREFAIVIGRSLAAGAHPYAVWRLRSSRQKVMLAAMYFFGGFVSVLGTLILLGVFARF